MTGGGISWSSKKQTSVAISSGEAEQVSCYSAAEEAIFLSNVLSTMFGDENPNPITICLENNRSICLANNMSMNARNKHIYIQYQFVHYALSRKDI